ncbi:hypothetical protein TWF481_003771 [Arthrobotrys musiformis]|uniref:Uncharacterized protein n=1 Tax=Arthrobotrys musiformis TaxID=47236 RepID=A0AAV9WJG5_9PEZI
MRPCNLSRRFLPVHPRTSFVLFFWLAIVSGVNSSPVSPLDFKDSSTRVYTNASSPKDTTVSFEPVSSGIPTNTLFSTNFNATYTTTINTTRATHTAEKYPNTSRDDCSADMNCTNILSRTHASNSSVSATSTVGIADTGTAIATDATKSIDGVHAASTLDATATTTLEPSLETSSLKRGPKLEDFYARSGLRVQCNSERWVLDRIMRRIFQEEQQSGRPHALRTGLGMLLADEYITKGNGAASIVWREDLNTLQRWYDSIGGSGLRSQTEQALNLIRMRHRSCAACTCSSTGVMGPSRSSFHQCLAPFHARVCTALYGCSCFAKLMAVVGERRMGVNTRTWSAEEIRNVINQIPGSVRHHPINAGWSARVVGHPGRFGFDMGVDLGSGPDGDRTQGLDLRGQSLVRETANFGSLGGRPGYDPWDENEMVADENLYGPDVYDKNGQLVEMGKLEFVNIYKSPPNGGGHRGGNYWDDFPGGFGGFGPGGSGAGSGLSSRRKRDEGALSDADVPSEVGDVNASCGRESSGDEGAPERCTEGNTSLGEAPA